MIRSNFSDKLLFQLPNLMVSCFSKLCSFLFFLVIFKVSGFMSIAVAVLFGNSFNKVIAKQPVPVPRSRMDI